MQALQLKQRLMLIRKENVITKPEDINLDHHVAPVVVKPVLPIGETNFNHVKNISTVKEIPRGMPAYRYDGPPLGGAPPMARNNPAPVPIFAANRGQGSMDHKQRQMQKAKEITYLGQLEQVVKSNHTADRATSITKEYHEQKAMNDQIIKSQLSKQNEKLMERLKERQINSFNKSVARGNSVLKERGTFWALTQKQPMRRSPKTQRTFCQV